MKNMILIEDDKVHHLGQSLGEHADKILHWYHKMGRELHDYLTYKHCYVSTMKKDTEQKAMMIDEFKHFKHAQKEFYDLLKGFADSDEEKTIFESLK